MFNATKIKPYLIIESFTRIQDMPYPVQYVLLHALPAILKMTPPGMSEPPKGLYFRKKLPDCKLKASEESLIKVDHKELPSPFLEQELQSVFFSQNYSQCIKDFYFFKNKIIKIRPE